MKRVVNIVVLLFLVYAGKLDASIFPWLDGLTGGLNGLAGGLRDYPCFQCREKCITYSWRCDGEVDCYAAEDEAQCEFICPYQTHHRCSDTGLCIDNHDLCDGHYDCENGEDERNCGHGPWMKRGVQAYQDKARTASGDQMPEPSDREWSEMGYRASNSTLKKNRQAANANRVQS